MQASESGYNTKYPRVPNGITEPEYSIDVGTHTFSDCVKKANVKDPSDTEHIYLALQGYNYGSGYIEWALSNFGGYSKYNAQQFSDMKKQELNVSGYGVSIPWWRSHPIHKNRATESIWTEPCNPLLRAAKSTKRATFNL